MLRSATFRITSYSIILLLTSCVTSIEPIVKVPPVVIESSRALFLGQSANISSINFQDLRLTDEVVSPGFVSPEGDISGALSKSLKSALQDREVVFRKDSSTEIKGSVNIWEAHFEGTASITLRSEAAISVNVIKSGRSIYNGTYNGVRSSSFPIVGAQDVQDSLGL